MTSQEKYLFAQQVTEALLDRSSSKVSQAEFAKLIKIPIVLNEIS